MDAVLDAMDKHIDAELWVMGYLLQGSDRFSIGLRGMGFTGSRLISG